MSALRLLINCLTIYSEAAQAATTLLRADPITSSVIVSQRQHEGNVHKAVRFLLIKLCIVTLDLVLGLYTR